MPAGIAGSNKALPLLSVTGQPLDGASAVVHVLQFGFHSSLPGCLRSTTLLLSPWVPAAVRGSSSNDGGKNV